MPLPNNTTNTVLSGVTQIKLFMNRNKTPDWEEVEKDVNELLIEHKDSIKVLDIKYTASEPNPDNP